MNEDRYKYYIEICRCENITKAAENLYISQPALSKFVSRLEKEIGTKLIDRDCVPIKLTLAGEMYLEYSKDMFKRYEKMKVDLEELVEKASKTISFGIATNLSQYYLNNVIKIASDINTGYNFKVVEGTSLNMEQYVENGEVDMAFFSTDNINNKKMNFTVVKEDCIYLVCSRDNPALLNRKKIVVNGVETYLFSKDEILNLEFYSRDKGFKLTETVEKYIASKGIEIKKTTYVSDIYTLLYLVKDTNGFGFLPLFFLEENNLMEETSLCCVDGDVIQWHMVLAMPKNSNVSKPIKMWIEKVKEFYAEKK